MRVLLTGSRTWDHRDSIRAALDRLAAFHGELTLVHGGAGGADTIAHTWAVLRRREGWPVRVERYPADWARSPRGAGMIRNQKMVNLGADLCVAFIRDRSSGASRCADMARKAGIPVEAYLWDDRDTLATAAIQAGGTDA